MLVLHYILYQNYVLNEDIDTIYLNLLESFLQNKINEKFIISEYDDEEL